MDGEDDHVHLLVAYPPKTETQGRLRRPRYPSPPSTAGLVAHWVNDRQTGGLVPFEAVKEELRQHLNEAAGRQAMHQYLSGLVQAATIEGYQMPA